MHSYCRTCAKPFQTYKERNTHEEQIHFHNDVYAALRGRRDLKPRSIKCGLCNDILPSRRHWFEHIHSVHPNQVGYGNNNLPLKSLPWPIDDSPFDKMTDKDSLLLEAEYNLNTEQILENDNLNSSSPYRTYNFPLVGGVSDAELKMQLDYIYSQQKYSFKFNLSLGYILQADEQEHEATENRGKIMPKEIRYFSPSTNNYVLDTPIQVKTYSDLQKAIKELQALNINEYVKKPQSIYKIKFITNVKYFLFELARPLGCQNVKLPPYISRRRCICSSCKCENNLCMFIAIAQAQKYRETGSRKVLVDVKVNARYLCEQWICYAYERGLLEKKYDTTEFPGVLIDHLPYLEDCIQTAIQIYCLKPTLEAEAVYISMKVKEYESIIYLNQYNEHINLILDIDNYCGYYACKICNRLFKRRFRTEQHMKICTHKRRIRFGNGFFKQRKHIFDRLEEIGIYVEPSTGRNSFFCTWDLEACLPRCHVLTQSKKLIYTNRHIPVCSAVCSNIPGYTEAKVIFEPNPNSLVNKMMKYMENIREAASKICTEKWGWVVEELSERITERRAELLNKQIEHAVTIELDEVLLEEMEVTIDEECETERLKCGKRVDPYLTLLSRYKREMVNYINQLILLSFNGGIYDVNLIKQQLAKYFIDSYKEQQRDALNNLDENGELSEDFHQNHEPCIIKKGNKYILLANQDFRMLDMVNYLAVGTSYSNYLKLFGCKEQKLIFPYDFLDSYEKLYQTTLPEYPSEHWFNRLHNTDLLNAEYENWLHNHQREEGNKPKNGYEKYQEICNMWKTLKFKSMFDYLKIYAQADVKPFITATESFMAIWTEKGIDVFKETVSLPSLCNIIMWEYSIKNNISFPLIEQQHREVYYGLRASVIAGASIVYTRFQCKGQTMVRYKSNKLTQCLAGFDCNALYGYCLAGDMPINSYVIRKREDRFKPIQSKRNHLMYLWLKYRESVDGVSIKSKQTHGFECRVGGNYFADGMSIIRNEDSGVYIIRLYEYYGCRYHGCVIADCPTYKQLKNEMWYQEKYKQTMKRERDIKAMGYEIVVEWSCQFERLIKQTPSLAIARNKFRPAFYARRPYETNEQTILKSTLDGEFFGLLRVNVCVHSDKEYLYNDFPILFCSMQIKYEHLSSNMKEYLKENNMTYNSKKLLIAENRAENIYLSSDYIQFILETGHFHVELLDCIEFCKAPVFQEFITYVVEQRRAAKADPVKKAIANTWKLLSNAAYGKSLQNRLKHVKTRYVTGDAYVRNQVNDPLFRALTPMGEDCYEIEYAPKVTNIDFPFYIANIILGRAKTELIKFVYRCLYTYIDRSCLSIIHTDTDSIYLSTSYPSIEESIKPEMKDKYMKNIYGKCGKDQTKEIEFYFPRECCEKCAGFDSSQPGIWKIEAQPTECYSICSKSYICYNEDTGETKISCKGIAKRNIQQHPDPVSLYRKVLLERSSFSGQNKGFMVVRDGIVTYQANKRAFHYLYVKRAIVDQQGIFTQPLFLTLNPAPLDVLCIQQDATILSLDHRFPIKVFNLNFMSIRQALVYLIALHLKAEDEQELIMRDSSIENLTNIYKLLSKRDKLGVRVTLLSQIVQSKYDLCALAKNVVDENDGLDIINADIDPFLGTGENWAVLRWQNRSEWGGQNRLGCAWVACRNNKY